MENDTEKKGEEDVNHVEDQAYDGDYYKRTVATTTSALSWMTVDSFESNEISRRESIGISSTKIMCKNAEERDVELYDKDFDSDIDVGEGVNIEV